MSAAVKILFGLGAVAFVLAGAAASPHALRHLDGFQVRRVEVRGTRFLLPDDAVRATGITLRSNLFDDLAPWKEALERHPLVAAARIDRVLPATVRLVITEAQPIAWLPGAGGGVGATEGAVAGAGTVFLQPVSADGEFLPIDLAAADLDLPVVSAPAPATAPSVTDAATLGTLRLLERLRRDEPDLYNWISAAAPLRGNGVSLWLRSPAGAQALLPSEPDSVQLHQLKVALADLAARQEIDRLVRVDARFREQIVTTVTRRVKSE